jgi:SAM-dependent methyltransferase
VEPGQQQRLGSDADQNALSASGGAAGAYEEVAYPGYAYPHTHPARLEALARLFGLTPAPAAGCRVLELGCGDGANALAIAQTLPGATVVGVDASASAIARGRALAAAAKLGNVELRAEDFSEVESLARLGPFDYVIAHGVYSWIAPAARGSLLELTRRVLPPQGIALVSYNAYPGSYLRDMARDILAYHLQGVDAPAERLARAQHLMRTIVSVDSPTPYVRVLREQLQRMLDGSDALLYHDDLAAISTPFYFHEFMTHAAAHGLQFLSEADLADSQLTDVPEGVAELVASLPRDVVVREQHLDFFTNRAFRRTLLVPAELPLGRVLDDAALEALVLSSPARRTEDGYVSGDGAVMRTADPLVAAAMDELCQRWPEPVALPALFAAAARRAGTEPVSGEVRRGLRRVLLDAHLAHLVLLSAGTPALTAHPGPRPLASALVRAQCAAGAQVLSTLIPGNLPLDDEADRRLLALLDGTRDRPALAAQLAITPDSLEQALQRLAGHGLISH